jgi:hypothetical protein
MWWTHPSWKQQCCADCGVNIWDAGGDPDHDVCYECFMVRWEQEHQPFENPEEFDMETSEEICACSPYVCTEPDVSPLVRAMMGAWFEVADYEDEYQNDPAEKVVGWNKIAPARYRICTWFTGYGECQTAEQWEYQQSVPW